MTMPTDLEISRRAVLRPLSEVAADIGLGPHLLEPYGSAAAKISLDAVTELADRPLAKGEGAPESNHRPLAKGEGVPESNHRPLARYVVVSAITPTPPGEGKTTTTVGLGQAFGQLGKQAIVAIRQPSMGPTFGTKGGASGGGYAQVAPMESLNLHLTGDMHAVTAAHNVLAAMVGNHIHHGNALGLDPQEVTWRRVLDVNDRELRSIVTGLGSRADGTPQQNGFDITAASEVMAVLALSTGLDDLRERLGRIVVGYTHEGEPVTAEALKAAGAMCVMLRDAIKPNLMQTVEQTPVLVHCGPFGNIAHGNSSVVADLIGIHAGDYLITEAGFGADMGAERFFNIKCRASGLRPDAAVVVTTVRAMKAHTGKYHLPAGKPLPPELFAEKPDDVLAGAMNLRKQIANIRRHGVTPVVAINAFSTDYPSEVQAIHDIATEEGVRSATCTHFSHGGKGAQALAEAVALACDEPSGFRFLYPDAMPLAEKISTVAREMYGADGVDFSPTAERQLNRYERLGYGTFPVCIAKTHLSLSADPARKGAPTGWRLPVREVRASVGAGYIYPICGDMRTMPGLSASPAAERIDIDATGQIVGLT